ncbi:MAG: hypothetical protein V1688_04245 [bacterium]
MRLNDRNKAIELHLKGKTYNEIREIIPNLSKSTLCSWLKNIQLTTEQKYHIQEKITRGRDKARLKGAWANQEKKIKSILAAKFEARQTFPELMRKPLFITGLALYWAEGSKTQEHFQFMNSDPYAIKIMVRWLIDFCQIPKDSIKFRLYIHKIYAHEACENFWSKIIDVQASTFQKTVYKPTPHKVKKNPNYKGCMRVSCGGVELFRKVMGWKELFVEYFNSID